jgi:hypothetical protein
MANDVTSKVILGLDPSEFRRGIQQVDAKLKETSKLFDNLGAAVGAAFAGGAIINFAKDAMRLGDELQKVSQGFGRFGGEANLQQLRKATNGLLTDLELMKTATKAGTFGIGIGEMGNLLQFAKRRAQETGQEVQYLVDSIVTGIGRKSPLILDNLGISATHLRSKLNGVSVEAASVADVSRAVGEIATEQLRLMGDAAVTATDRMQQLNVRWENLKANIGTGLQGAALQTYDIFDKFFHYMKGGLFGMRDIVLEMNGIITEQSILRMREMANAVSAVSPGATEPNRPAGPAALNFGNFSENTLANMRAQLAAFNAELENVGIGSARFTELRGQIEALEASIRRLTEPAKQVFVVPTEEAIKLKDKGLMPVANGILYMDQVLQTAGIPSFDEFGRMIKGAKEQLEQMDRQLQAASMVGAEFGYILSESFRASIENGEDFFQVMKKALLDYVKQMAIALATTAALAAIFTVVTGGAGAGFGSIFGAISKTTGLGSFFGEGGLFNMKATVSGSDLILGTDRANNNRRRSGG